MSDRARRWQPASALRPVTPEEIPPQFKLERLLQVSFRPQQTGLEKRTEGPAAFGRAPHRVLDRYALRLENVIGEHMPYGPGALALVTAEQIVEFQRAREQTQHLFLYRLVFDLQDMPQEKSQAQQLPSR